MSVVLSYSCHSYLDVTRVHFRIAKNGHNDNFVCVVFARVVQHECIPQAVLGMDILCQAKSGMGKTAVFVLATLQQLEPTENQVHVLVMCHTRELAFQISKEYERFSKYMPATKVGVFFGGMPIQKDEETLKTVNPHLVVGTPGRILALIRNKKLNLKHLKHFILDECDKMLEALGKHIFMINQISFCLSTMMIPMIGTYEYLYLIICLEV